MTQLKLDLAGLASIRGLTITSDFNVFEEFGAGRIARSPKAAEGRAHSKTLSRLLNADGAHKGAFRNPMAHTL